MLICQFPNFSLQSISDREQGKFKSNVGFSKVLIKDLREGLNKGSYVIAKVIAAFPSELGSAM